MSLSREQHKFERVTLTLVPRADDRTLLHIPSTFNKVERTYAWRTSGSLNYMLVPTRISSTEIKVDLFVDPLRKGKVQLKSLSEDSPGTCQRQDPDRVARPETRKHQPGRRRPFHRTPRSSAVRSRRSSAPVSNVKAENGFSCLIASSSPPQRRRLSHRSRGKSVTSTTWANGFSWLPPTVFPHLMLFCPMGSRAKGKY